MSEIGDQRSDVGGQSQMSEQMRRSEVRDRKQKSEIRSKNERRRIIDHTSEHSSDFTTLFREDHMIAFRQILAIIRKIEPSCPSRHSRHPRPSVYSRSGLRISALPMPPANSYRLSERNVGFDRSTNTSPRPGTFCSPRKSPSPARTLFDKQLDPSLI